MTIEEIDFDYPRPSTCPAISRPCKATSGRSSRRPRLIAAAKRPVLYVGGGVISSGAHEEVRALAEKANLPTTLR